MSPDTDVVTIVKRIATYLRQHPKASDMPQGIARWWLAPDDQATPAAVEAALQWMRDCGAVAAVPAADGRVHYRCRDDVDDLAARLDILTRDPHALLPARPPHASGSN